MSKKIDIRLLGGGLLILALLVISSFAVFSPDPEPTPTPTNTPVPSATPLPSPTAFPQYHITLLGGQGIYANETIKQDLLAREFPSQPGVTYSEMVVNAMSMSTGQMLSYNKGDYSQVHGVFVGDAKYVNDFKSKNPDVKIHTIYKMFITKLGVQTWWQYADKLIEAKAVYQAEDGSYHLTPTWQKTILDAQDKQKQWTDIGIDLPGVVDLNSTSWNSSTGIEAMAWMASCFRTDSKAYPCTKPIQDTEVNSVVSYLIRYIDSQGGQGSGSLLEFAQWATKGPGNKFFITYDSTFATSMQTELGFTLAEVQEIAKRPDNYDTVANRKHMVFIYFDYAPYAEHTLICLDNDINRLPGGGNMCAELAKKTQVTEISEAAWVELGMTTKAVFFSNPPVLWMTSEAILGEKPTDSTFVALEAAIAKGLKP